MDKQLNLKLHLELVIFHNQKFNEVCDEILAVLDRENDLTPEQQFFWINYGMSLAEIIREICRENRPLAALCDAHNELKTKAENAWLN